jgi:hypothetical protein
MTFDQGAFLPRPELRRSPYAALSERDVESDQRTNEPARRDLGGDLGEAGSVFSRGWEYRYPSRRPDARGMF